MARKIKFALEMADGNKVRSMDELREHFDADKVLGYFVDGKLIEWLEDRFYEDEADQLKKIDKAVPSLKKICDILGVEYDGESDVDVDMIEWLNERKKILMEKTDDATIISNADKTALNQEDLADLLELGENVIYLCGEKFSIPIRYENKKYIGVLSKPKISIKAKSVEELAGKNIVFENVDLPWSKAELEKDNNDDLNNSKNFLNNEIDDDNNELIDVSVLSAMLNTKAYLREKWYAVEYGHGTSNQWYREFNIPDGVKKLCMQLICQNKYSQNDILHMHMDTSLTYGWALTKDSFCSGGKLGRAIIYYKDIQYASATDTWLYIITKDNEYTFDTENIAECLIFDGVGEYLADFLMGVRDLLNSMGEGSCQINNQMNDRMDVDSYMDDKPLNFVGSQWDDHVINAVKSYIGGDLELKKFVNSFNSGDYTAKEIAMSIGRQCIDYLPMGGTPEENAHDVIYNVEAYLDSK